MTSSTVMRPTRRPMESTTGMATRSYFSKSMATSSIGVSVFTDAGFSSMTWRIFDTDGWVIRVFSGSMPRRR